MTRQYPCRPRLFDERGQFSPRIGVHLLCRLDRAHWIQRFDRPATSFISSNQRSEYVKPIVGIGTFFRSPQCLDLPKRCLMVSLECASHAHLQEQFGQHNALGPRCIRGCGLAGW